MSRLVHLAVGVIAQGAVWGSRVARRGDLCPLQMAVLPPFPSTLTEVLVVA